MKFLKINFSSCAFIIYCLVSLIITIYHEPFKNEAQAWLIARDLNISGILNIMWYEGTPALWHLIIYPFAKLGLPYFSMQIIHWLFAVGIAALIIFKSPFPRFFKYFLPFTYYFIYEYCAMARNYNISILLIFLLAALWKNKHEKPALFCILVILLINTNLVVWGFGIAISLLFLYEHRQKRQKITLELVLSLIALATGFLIVLFQIIPREQLHQHSVVTFSFWDIQFPEMLIKAPANALLSAGGEAASMIVPFFLFLCSVCILLLLVKNFPVFVAAILSTAWCMYMFMYIYRGGIRHHGFLMIIFLFFLWINYYYHKPCAPGFVPGYLLTEKYHDSVKLILLIAVISLLFRALSIIPQEIKYQFSGSKETARYIKDNELEDYCWAGYKEDVCLAVLPYFAQKQIWYTGIQEWGTYILWNNKLKENNCLADEEIYKRLNEQFPQEDKLLLIISRPLNAAEQHGYKLVFRNQQKIFWIHDENYYLYVRDKITGR